MGIKLAGKEFSSATEVLSDISENSKWYQDYFSACRSAENQHWEDYTAAQVSSKRAELKAIYMDALCRGKSLDWARGKAEGRGLDSDKFEDEEVQAICGLF